MTGAKLRATCRLQLNRAFTFADAEAILPYLDALGISHIHASPVTVAQPGSAHGYDVIDPTRINPELGGEEGLRSLVAALRRRGMGIVVDIVPNHMSVTGGANRWWNDVLAKGRGSPHARFFDIDWSEPILLPFLAGPLDEALAAGALALVRDEAGRLRVVAYGRDLYPVREEDQRGGSLAELLARQHYRLADWRTAGEELNWRRFFTISGLAGIRVEDEAVFEATHALFFRLYDEGLIDGVRVDHVDGLADPGQYCRRLRARMAGAWIIVEKILAAGEALPQDWGVDGTTGYDFLEEASLLLHDPAGEAPLAGYWAKLSGRSPAFADEEIEARRERLAGEFRGQLRACARAFAAALDPPASAAGDIRTALDYLLCAFPAYRTYGGATDAPILAAARDRALALAGPGRAPAIDRLLSVLAEPGDSALRAEAARRFAQLSAPLAAKAVEDGAFYRYGRLLSRNEVGSDPSRVAMMAADFHRAMARRAERWPRSMLATATHDHKRGEDVRARLAVLSELPDLWIATAERWRAMNRALAEGIDPADEYQLYQMLVGAWPGAGAGPGFAARAWTWFEKALREAGLRSTWRDPDARYEARCRAFVESLLDPAGRAGFVGDLGGFVRRVAPAGEAVSLVQTFLRCTAPGLPDLYQGCEFADLSLVDPDNRRPVDFARRIAALGARPRDFDAVKQQLIARLLDLRRRHPDLWAHGDWQPVAVEGERASHLLAFARRHGDQAMLGAVALRCAGILAETGDRTPPRDWWGDTRLRSDGAPLAADLFGGLPVYLSLSEGGMKVERVKGIEPCASSGRTERRKASRVRQRSDLERVKGIEPSS